MFNKGKLVANLIKIKIIPNKIIFYTPVISVIYGSALEWFSCAKVQHSRILNDETDDKLMIFYYTLSRYASTNITYTSCFRFNR